VGELVYFARQRPVKRDESIRKLLQELLNSNEELTELIFRANGRTGIAGTYTEKPQLAVQHAIEMASDIQHWATETHRQIVTN